MYRGVSTEITYSALQEKTGRDQEDLKRWCDLYERYPKFENFLEEYAKGFAGLVHNRGHNHDVASKGVTPSRDSQADPLLPFQAAFV